MSKYNEKHAQAVQWLIESQRGEEPSQSKVHEWEQWIADPQHQASFDAAAEVWERCGTERFLHLPDPEELAADDYDGSESIEEWSARRATNAAGEPGKQPRVLGATDTPPSSALPQPRRWRRGFAFAAAASIALIGWIAYPQLRSLFMSEPKFYETSLAEHRTVELEDGSRLLLGARTSLWVTFTRHRRIVVLDRGEALFDVARDPQRPFAVHAGYGTITAVGTSFSVQRDREHVEVTVAEGVVRVEPRTSDSKETASRIGERPVVATLTRNQQVSYDERGSGKIYIARVDAELATAWREGRLQYIDESLRNVIADVNRYSKRQIVLDEPPTYDLRFTGVVFQDNAERWADHLTDVFPALEVVEASADHITLRMRATDRTSDPGQ